MDEVEELIRLCGRALVSQMGETAGFELHMTRGCVLALTGEPAGNTAAISAMATPPERQRRGVGRALLTSVIEDYRARGVERFHLIASEAGFPLYSSLGFETIANLSAWILMD